MNFLEKLDFLMQEKSLNKSTLSKISRIPYTTIDGFYKKGYQNTKLSTIWKLANALNVSLDYLIDDRVDDPNPKEWASIPCDKTEHELLALYRELNQEGKEKVVGYARDLVRTSDYKKVGSFWMGSKEA